MTKVPGTPAVRKPACKQCVDAGESDPTRHLVMVNGNWMCKEHVRVGKTPRRMQLGIALPKGVEIESEQPIKLGELLQQRLPNRAFLRAAERKRNGRRNTHPR